MPDKRKGRFKGHGPTGIQIPRGSNVAWLECSEVPWRTDGGGTLQWPQQYYSLAWPTYSGSFIHFIIIIGKWVNFVSFGGVLCNITTFGDKRNSYSTFPWLLLYDLHINKNSISFLIDCKSVAKYRAIIIWSVGGWRWIRYLLGNDVVICTMFKFASEKLFFFSLWLVFVIVRVPCPSTWTEWMRFLWAVLFSISLVSLLLNSDDDHCGQGQRSSCALKWFTGLVFAAICKWQSCRIVECRRRRRRVFSGYITISDQTSHRRSWCSYTD